MLLQVGFFNKDATHVKEIPHDATPPHTGGRLFRDVSPARALRNYSLNPRTLRKAFNEVPEALKKAGDPSSGSKQLKLLLKSQ